MASRTKRGRSGSTLTTATALTPEEQVLQAVGCTPLIKLAAKTMLYSTTNVHAGSSSSKLTPEETELWQKFDAVVVAKCGVDFDRVDRNMDWKAFLRDNVDGPSRDSLLNLIQARMPQQVSLCEFFLNSSTLQTDQKMSRIFEYRLRKPLALLSDSVTALAQTFPAPTQTDDIDVSHVWPSHANAALYLARVLDDAQAQGWQVAGNECVVLRCPHVLEVLDLVDDDKKAGLSQMLLTDMFTKMSLRGSEKSA